MTRLQQDLLKALITAQTSVVDYSEQDVTDRSHDALDAIDSCLKEATRLAKKLRKEHDE